MTRSICIIDDDQIYQIIVKKIVAKAEIFNKVACYENSSEALTDLRSAETRLPDLILLDINMPGMDGWEFLTALSNHRPNLQNETCIFIVTSSIAESDREKALSMPIVSGFISKPLSVSKLKEIGEKLFS